MIDGVRSVLRVVLDTNVVVSSLVFTRGRMASLRLAWQGQRFVPVVSPQTAQELREVLGYRKFRIDVVEQHNLLADYLPYTEVHHPATNIPGLPRCRDPKDQMFLELAASARVDYLVSGDDDLLVLAETNWPELSFRCVSVPVFLAQLT